MRKQKKWLGWLIRISLLVMITISVLLSGKIWLASNRYDTQQNNNTKQQQNNQATKINKNLADVFVPEVAIYHQKNHKTIMSYDENFLQKINKDIQEWNFVKYNQPSKLSKETYFHLLTKENVLELEFPDKITLGIFKNLYQQNIPNKKENLSFNRMLISLHQNNPTVYFMNDNDFQVFEARMREFDTSKIIKKLQNMKSSTEVLLYSDLAFPFYVTDKNFEIPSYTYLLNKQSPDFYAQSLFEDAGDIKETDSKKLIEYSDGKYSRMSINQNSGFLQYESYALKQNIANTNEFLDASFQQLNKLSYVSNNMHYFSMSDTSQSITFRDYVSGYPVFNDSNAGNGNLYVQMSEGGINIETSLYNLQVPLPRDEKKSSDLMSSQALLNTLTDKGYEIEKIQGLKMGYLWRKSDESPLVADLEPTWFVRYENEWKDVRELN